MKQRTVVRTKNVVYMPCGLSFSLMANTLCWFLYGLLLKNIFICVSEVWNFKTIDTFCFAFTFWPMICLIQIPNAVGVVSGMLQLVVYVRYMDKKGTLEVSLHLLLLTCMETTPISYFTLVKWYAIHVLLWLTLL